MSPASNDNSLEFKWSRKRVFDRMTVLVMLEKLKESTEAEVVDIQLKL